MNYGRTAAVRCNNAARTSEKENPEFEGPAGRLAASRIKSRTCKPTNAEWEEDMSGDTTHEGLAGLVMQTVKVGKIN